ncbi:putative Ig domain-containing protein [Frigidibacter sp. RF13]|uniref:PKD domain-containing protein n=1 Tax=Frigidibacter sp. RF13 TaxID=2997340 RepID=UPI0022720CBC|nr:putative Ig domain-containing protein [Frigidibacter sp. RF13]MCY1125457.1 putative Ig domain-containing protein [Frigidibacter sp. RF13]
MRVQAGVFGRAMRIGFVGFLVALAILRGTAAEAQHTSTECPAQTGTVTSGGTVTIDISDCEFAYLAGGEGAIDGGSFGSPDFENHGTATTRHAAGQWLLDYSHNGSTGIGGTDVFELTDGSLLGNGDILFTITINPASSPVTVSPASLPTLTAGVAFSQTLTSSGGTAPYTYTLQSGTLPPGLSLTSGGVISGTPTQRGAYSFSVRSTDNIAQFVDKGYTGTVQNPTLTLNTAAGTAGQNSAFSQTLSVTGGVAPYSFLLETGSLPSGITLSSGGVVSGTTSAAPGTYPVTIRVTDSSTGPGSYFEVENYTLTVTTNLAPTANAGPDQSVASAASVSMTGAGSSDPESQPLSYGWTQTAGPTVTLTGAATASPSFTAPTVAWNASAQVLTFQLIVNDGVQNSVADTVDITVNPAANLAPTANAGPDQSVASAASVSMTGAGSSDPESQPLSYGWTQTAGPTVTLTGAATASPSFTAPTVAWNASAQVLTFQLIVNDGVQNSVADTVDVTVNPAANLAPTANAGPDQSVASAASVSLTGAGSSDPESQPLSYGWTQTAGPTVTLTGAATASPSFTAPTVAWNASAQVLTFQLIVNDGVQNSVADTVSITVNPAANLAPTANAGPDQSVASAALVSLTGAGSSDPESQPLSYGWTQTAGPTVTLTGAATASPGFTAPTLGWNAPAAVLTFQLIVNDGVQNSAADSVDVTVNAPVDTTAPSVTLSGLPATLLPGQGASVTVTFSEPVTGLGTGSFSLTGGSATTLTGSGASYVLSLVASGAGGVTLSLPAGAVIDVAANGNLASNVLQASSGTATETGKAIARFMETRANKLVSAQPGLIGLLTPSATPSLSVSRGDVTFALGGEGNVWTSLRSQWGESGGADTRYVLGAVGTHMWLNDRTILGAMLEFDRLTQTETGREITGTGWLIGPYVAGRFEGQPLSYEARLLWGRTDNEIAQFGLPADRFEGERLLAQIKLQGEFSLGETVLTPSLDATYVTEAQDAFIDGLGNPIPEQEIRQTQLAFGLDLHRSFEVDGGTLVPMAGFAIVYSDTSGTGTATLVTPPHDDWRGRLKAGLTYSRDLSTFQATTFYDGVNADDYRDFGLELSFETKF